MTRGPQKKALTLLAEEEPRDVMLLGLVSLRLSLGLKTETIKNLRVEEETSVAATCSERWRKRARDPARGSPGPPRAGAGAPEPGRGWGNFPGLANTLGTAGGRGRRCHPPEELSERQTPSQRPVPGVAPRAIRCGRNLQGCPQCRAWTGLLRAERG